MKTLKNICIWISALSMCFTSCSKENVSAEEPQDNYVTVGLTCIGELLEITNSPLTKVGGYEQYTISVYSLQKSDMMSENGEPYYVETPYAHGYFYNSLEGVNIKLLNGENYRFKVAVVKQNQTMPTAETHNTEFTYSSSSNITVYEQIPIYSESYYGELDRYTAVEGGNVNIETKRVSYGAKFIAEDLTEGTLKINLLYDSWSNFTTYLTPENPVNDNIYSFKSWEVLNAWSAACKNEKYTRTYQIEINWTKANGEVMPIGTYNVTFERNVRTTIRIKAEELTASKGITVTIEDSGYTDAENEYYIQGGQLVETPINGGN